MKSKLITDTKTLTKFKVMIKNKKRRLIYKCHYCNKQFNSIKWNAEFDTKFNQLHCVVSCPKCGYKHCRIFEKPKPTDDFLYLTEMIRFSYTKKPVWLKKELASAANEWLKDKPTNTLFKGYYWMFKVWIQQERIWNYREFQEGKEYGINCKNCDRDANPYTEESRHRSWDCGYIYALYKNKK